MCSTRDCILYIKSSTTGSLVFCVLFSFCVLVSFGFCFVLVVLVWFDVLQTLVLQKEKREKTIGQQKRWTQTQEKETESSTLKERKTLPSLFQANASRWNSSQITLCSSHAVTQHRIDWPCAMFGSGCSEAFNKSFFLSYYMLPNLPQGETEIYPTILLCGSHDLKLKISPGCSGLILLWKVHPFYLMAHRGHYHGTLRYGNFRIAHLSV